MEWARKKLGCVRCADNDVCDASSRFELRPALSACPGCPVGAAMPHLWSARVGLGGSCAGDLEASPRQRVGVLCAASGAPVVQHRAFGGVAGGDGGAGSETAGRVGAVAETSAAVVRTVGTGPARFAALRAVQEAPAARLRMQLPSFGGAARHGVGVAVASLPVCGVSSGVAVRGEGVVGGASSAGWCRSGVEGVGGSGPSSSGRARGGRAVPSGDRPPGPGVARDVDEAG